MGRPRLQFKIDEQRQTLLGALINPPIKNSTASLGKKIKKSLQMRSKMQKNCANQKELRQKAKKIVLKKKPKMQKKIHPKIQKCENLGGGSKSEKM